MLSTSEGEPGLNYPCKGYPPFFNHVSPYMQIMAVALQHSRALAEVIVHTRVQVKARPKNASCLCGSSKKVKHCGTGR